jgi:hypothetical protein
MSKENIRSHTQDNTEDCIREETKNIVGTIEEPRENKTQEKLQSTVQLQIKLKEELQIMCVK